MLRERSGVCARPAHGAVRDSSGSPRRRGANRPLASSHATSTEPSTAVSSSAPGQSPGQAQRAAGRPAAISEAAATQLAGQLPSRTNASPSSADRGRATRAASPRPVPSGAAVSIKQFARMPAAGIPGCSSRSSGPQASCAESATATGSTSHRGGPAANGQRFAVPRSRAGTISSIPAVAATERANPGCSACHGSAMSIAFMASPSAGNDLERCPPKSETSMTTAMIAARCTLESGPTMMTKPPSAIAAARMRSLRPKPRRLTSPMTQAVSRPMFAPDTAVTCTVDACFMLDSSASETSDVSPTAKPGSSSAPDTRLAVSRKPLRRSAATRALRSASRCRAPAAGDDRVPGGGGPMTSNASTRMP